MNRARVAMLLRELAEELEKEDEKPAKRGRVLPFPTSPIDEVAAAEAKRILERKGVKR